MIENLHQIFKSSEAINNPGQEEKSWQRFYSDAVNKFFTGKIKGNYENNLDNEFNQFLLSSLPRKGS